MPDVLLKRWNDWSAGIGYLVDDGRTPGMYYASGLLGLRGELRPAPFFNVVSPFTGDAGGSVVMAYVSDAAASFAHCGVGLKPSSGATTTVDAISTGKIAANAVLTFSHTVGAGSDQCLGVGVSSTGGAEPTGITYNGVAMTKVGDVSVAATGTASLWQLVAPATGAHDVVVTHAGAVDIVAGAVSFNNVHQAAPTGLFASTSAAASSDPTVLAVPSFPSGVVIDTLFCDAGTLDEGVDQTSRWEDTAGAAKGAGSTSLPGTELFPSSAYQFQYFFEDTATTDVSLPHLYAIRGTEKVLGTLFFATGGGTTGKALSVFAHKIDGGGNIATTGRAWAGSHRITDIREAGQPAKYEGLWYLPAGNDNDLRELTVIGGVQPVGDTLTAAGTGFVPGADHLGNLGNQLVGGVQDGTNAGGFRILKVGGAPRTAADWGSAFPVGDKDERPAGVRALGGLSFVLHQEGLYSFNSKARAGLVFEDYRLWRSVFSNLPLMPFRQGLLIPHPAGLLYYVPGDLPVGVGLGAGQGTRGIPPSSVTELHGGRFHSVAPVGDFLAAIYQPSITSTTVLVLVGLLASEAAPTFSWQALGTATLNDASTMLGCIVTTLTLDSGNRPTPFLWFGNAGNLNYLQLDPRGSPFRSRADTHKVNVSADAYMSELFFAEPVELTRVVVHTSADMVAGDEFQISLYSDAKGREENVGAPIKGSGTRHERKLDRHSVSRLVLRVNWTATSVADRVPPMITRIELYGGPEKESASAPRT